jgi:hypothetical protein
MIFFLSYFLDITTFSKVGVRSPSMSSIVGAKEEVSSLI